MPARDDDGAGDEGDVIGFHDDRLALVFYAPLLAALVVFAFARAPWLWARIVVAFAGQAVALIVALASAQKILVRGGFALVDIDGWSGARIDGVDPLGLVPAMLTPGTAPLLVGVAVAGLLAFWLLVPAALEARSSAPLAAVLSATAFTAMLVVARRIEGVCAAFALAGLAGFALLVSFRPARTDVEGALRAFLLQRAGDALLLGAVFIVGAGAGGLDLEKLPESAPLIDPWTRAASGPLQGFPASDIWLLVAGLVVAAAATRLAFGPLLPLVRDAVGVPGPAVGLAHGACFVGAGLILLVRTTPILWLAPGALAALGWIAAASTVVAGLVALAGRDLVRIDVHLLCGFGALAAFALGCADLGTAGLAVTALLVAAVPLCATTGVVVDATGRADPHGLGGLEKSLPRTHTARLLTTGGLFGALPLFAGGAIVAQSLARALFSPWLGPWAGGLVVAGAAVLALAAFRPLHLVFTGSGEREPLSRTAVEPRLLRTLPPLLVALPLLGAGFLHIPDGVLAMLPVRVSYISPAGSLWLPERAVLHPLREHVLAAWRPPHTGPVTVALVAFAALTAAWLVSVALYKNGPRKAHGKLFGGARRQRVVALLANLAGRESQVAKGVGESAARLSRLIATNLAPGVLDTFLRRIPALLGVVAGAVVRFVANGSAQRGVVVALLVLAVLLWVLR